MASTAYRRNEVHPEDDPFAIPSYEEMVFPQQRPPKPTGVALEQVAAASTADIPPQPKPIDVAPPPPEPILRPRQEEYIAAMKSQPEPDKPKLWQRIAAGALGGAAGYANAAGRVRIDPSVAIEGIMRPGYQDKLSNFQRDLEGKKLAAEQESADIKAGRETDESKARIAASNAAADASKARTIRDSAPPKKDTSVIGNKLIDNATGKAIYEGDDPKKPTEYDNRSTAADMLKLTGKDRDYFIMYGTPEKNATDDPIQVIQETDDRGNLTVAGLNKRTGEKTWSQVLPGAGKSKTAAASGSGENSSDDEMAQQIANGEMQLSSISTQGNRRARIESLAAKKYGYKPGPNYSAQERATLGALDGMGSIVSDLLADEKSLRGAVGMWDGKVTAALDKTFGGKDAEPRIRLRALLGELTGTIAKERGGTSFTPNEQALLETYAPVPGESDDAVVAKLRNLGTLLKRKRGTIASVNEESKGRGEEQGGQTSTKLPNGGGKPITSEAINIFMKAAGGNKAKAMELANQNGWK